MVRPMIATVVHVITQLELGGAQEITLVTCRRLDRRRFRVHLIHGPGGLLDDEASHLPETQVDCDGNLLRAIHPASDLRCLGSLTRRLRAIRRRSQGRPMIVHTHSSKAGIIGRWAARLAAADVIIHSIHGFGFNDRQPSWQRSFFQGLERLTAPITHAFCPVSAANLEVARRLGLLARGQRSLVLPSGIDPEEYRPRGGHALRAELGVGSETPLAGMIACLKPQKAPLTFVRVAALLAPRLPEAHFFIAGDGELRGDVQRAIADHGLERRFHLLGWRRDVPSLLDASDVLVLTSLWEGLPRVALQAMAAAKPIVASAVDGTPEAVIDGVTGHLLAPDDLSGFAERLERLLRSPELRRSMGTAAYARLADFRIELTMQKLEAFYEELLHGH